MRRALATVGRGFATVARIRARDVDVYRLLDIFAVAATSPVWLPLGVVVATIVKIAEPRSPIFFTHRRIGRGGEPFEMLKFRTMVIDADERKLEFLHLNEKQWPDFKITNDPRITSIGWWLRRTSVDELPQLLNVLRGEMAIVGPRPHSSELDRYKIWQTERLEVRQGITGFWQTGDRQSDFDVRVRLDLGHVRRESLWSWFLIVFGTVPAMTRGTFISK